MRKSVLSALISGAFLAAGSAHAGLTFDFDGVGGVGPVVANAFDWSPTSFLAKGGNTAIANFAGGACGSNPSACQFTVYTHATMSRYQDATDGKFKNLPIGGEITIVASFTERVVGFNGSDIAQFQTVGAGWVEFYYNATADAVNLTGSGFNNGRLIGRISGVTALNGNPAGGNFTISDPDPVNLDGNGSDDYAGQKTVSGFGVQNSLKFGKDGITLDDTFFITDLAEFVLNFTNISIGLPFGEVDPSDCFNNTPRTDGDVTNSFATQCLNVHDNTLQMDGQGNDGGVAPRIGALNGGNLAFPDFVAQTDYNSSVRGSVPEPGSLALVGMALGALGVAAARRRRG